MKAFNSKFLAKIHVPLRKVFANPVTFNDHDVANIAGEKKIMNKIVVNVIVVDVNVTINVNCTDYMHKKCFEINYSLCRDI